MNHVKCIFKLEEVDRVVCIWEVKSRAETTEDGGGVSESNENQAAPVSDVHSAPYRILPR